MSKNQTVTMLVGLPASGKSTLANELSNRNNVVISSDQLRFDLTNQYVTSQLNNVALFKALTHNVISVLKSGKNVIFDSTNLNSKKRKHFISQIKLEYSNININAIVMATPFNKCIELDNKREKKVGSDVIRRMRTHFQMPYYTEGFNNIELYHHYNHAEYTDAIGFRHSKLLEEIRDLLSKEYNINQYNTHHTHTIYGHIMHSYASLNRYSSIALKYATLLHDIGKKYTISFSTFKGLDSVHAHYNGHENVSSYEAMEWLSAIVSYNPQLVIKVCNLIQYHMRMHNVNTNKSRKKIMCVSGDLYDDLVELNKADRNGH